MDAITAFHPCNAVPGCHLEMELQEADLSFQSVLWWEVKLLSTVPLEALDGSWNWRWSQRSTVSSGSPALVLPSASVPTGKGFTVT